MITMKRLMTISFNPRTRTGCDAQRDKLSDISRFQSTHPHEVRHQVYAYQVTEEYRFQSTHPREVRPVSQYRIRLDRIQFQSTHPHEVRHCAMSYLRMPNI